MTQMGSRKDRLPGSFETGSPSVGNPKSIKVRRVSPRRELAVVTLGAVAAVAGLGGFLTANPPAWVVTQEKASQQAAASQQTVKETPKPQPAAERTVREAAKEQKAGAQQRATQEAEAEQQAAEQQAAAQYAAEQAQYSAPSQAPVAAVSRGS